MPHRKKILLSDSNEAFSMLLTDSLRERGNFHVFHAKDEDETTKALHRHRPHVLLLDFLLPHKGGFHVMQHLREDGYKISTIFMTALPTHRVIEEAYRLGASFVLPKPFTARALVERIHDALHSDRPLFAHIKNSDRHLKVSCCSPRWRSFIYEAYSILSGLSREAAFQPMFHQFRSVAARFAEPTADNGTDQGHSPSPFQSGCRSRRWPARHRAYWQRANFFTVPLTGCGSHNVPLRLSSPAFRPGRFLIRGLDLTFPRTAATGTQRSALSCSRWRSRTAHRRCRR